MANEEQLANNPLPGLPPNRRTDLGEGEYDVFMIILFPSQVTITLPQLCSSIGGGQGGGSNA